MSNINFMNNPDRPDNLGHDVTDFSKAAAGSNPGARLAVFIEKYSIKILGESKVAMILPGGVSRIEFLNEAQVICKRAHDKRAINPIQRRDWEWGMDDSYRQKSLGQLRISVDLLVDNSSRLKKSEMQANGWLDVDTKNVVLGHVAYFLATGQDPFRGMAVRTRDGTLQRCSLRDNPETGEALHDGVLGIEGATFSNQMRYGEYSQTSYSLQLKH